MAKKQGIAGAAQGIGPAQQSRGRKIGPVPDGDRWEDTHRRTTVWLSVDIWERVSDRAEATGESKSSIVQAAIEAYLR